MGRKWSLTEKARRRYVPQRGLVTDDWEFPSGYGELDESDLADVRMGEPGTREFWVAAERALRVEERELRPEVLRLALIAHGVPVWIADYVQKRLRGEPRTGRGRPPRSRVGRRGLKPGSSAFWLALEEDCSGRVEPDAVVLGEALVHLGIPHRVCERIVVAVAGGSRSRPGTPSRADLGLSPTESLLIRRALNEKKNGPTRFTNLETAYLREVIARYARYLDHCAAKKEVSRRDPYNTALDKVAGRYATTRDVLDKMCYPRRTGGGQSPMM